jgi:hypothetical protein
MKLEDYEYNFIDEIYAYKGLWERDSTCGLKIAELADKTLIIATDLYEENPGGSITEFVAELATLICDDFKLDKERIYFINHVPEVKSSLEFYAEAFYHVRFDLEEGVFVNPDWEKITRREVQAMVDAAQ